MNNEELSEIEARASAADVSRLIAEIRRFQPVVEASRQLEEARSKSNTAYRLMSEASEDLKRAEENLRTALAAL